MTDSDDDVPQLSVETFSALQEFYKEEEEKESKLLAAKRSSANSDLQYDENWQLSQFWYDDATVNKFCEIAKKTIKPGDKIALISCPTLYKKIKELDCEIALFEFDERFAVYGADFFMYDYKNPLSIPRDRNSYYDLVIADPPFLSEECLTKTSITIKYLAKNNIILCTGATMCELAERLLNLKRVAKFDPKHKNNLANEFCCYSNYNIDELL